MKFLVIGNAVDETVLRTEDSTKRRHTGGVGAIMARELGLAGAQVTFLTTAVPGINAETCVSRMAGYGVTAIAVPGNPRQDRRSCVTIRTENGEYAGATGQWARMGGVAAEIQRLAPEHDWTLVSMNLLPGDLQAALKHSLNLASNATSKKLAPRLLSLKGQRAVTMNSAEAGQVMTHIGRGDPEMMPEHCGADIALVTRGSRGYSIISRGERALRVNAGAAPAGADFIGAGDAATAGLAYSMAMGLEATETIGSFVHALLERNAAGYRG